MTIGAHPDDAEFGAGGTLARWAAAGCEVSMLVVTDGSKGTWDPTLDPPRLAQIRSNEQQQAADVLGATDIVMLEHRDGELESTMALREELCLWIRRLRPDVVLTHDPWRRYMLHPDHRATGWAVVDAVVAARDHLFFREQLVEGLTEHRPEALLLWAADEPDHWEGISDSLDQKVEALLCHSSQGTTTMGDAHGSAEGRRKFARRLRDWAEQQGRPVGLDVAESFKMIRP
jgi:LmbE family N-acetylglucosaminyl deacetylase